MHLPSQQPIRPVGRYETRDRHRRAVGEQFRDLGDPPDVLGAVGGREAEVLVQSEADVVAVEAVSREGVLQQVLFEGGGDGGFAGGGEAGEPDCEAGLVSEGGALGVREGGVPGYVSVGEGVSLLGWR